ncbi:MAG: thioredoxin family protein [Bacteroidales bacterium]|nr:thioredoxin family protein [Bacteroidales bacterium]
MRNIFKSLVLALCLIPFTTAFAQLNPAHWNFNVKELSSNEVELQFQLKLDEGWHIYSQKSDPNGPIPSEYTFEDNANYKRVGGVAEPKSHDEFDEIFKCTVRSFSGKVTFRQKIKRNTDKAFEVKGSMYYQLCNDGSCIAPDDVPFTFKVPASTMPANEENEPEIAENVDTAIVEPIVDEESASPAAEVAAADPEPQEPENKKSLLGLFFGALLAGIVTMFTPCVFPMIPMTVNFFMHSSDNKRKNRRQAWFFGFSIVFIFAVIGGILSLFFGPTALNFIGTHGIPNLIFFVIFFVFALSFFGLFEIKMPEKWVNASDAQADKGGLLAPFFIALTTVLVSFSCTGPIIGAALVEFTTSTTNRWIGLVSMLGFGIGFALPFTFLAFFPSMLKNMKSGGWLNSVKIVFAFLELAFGLKFLSMADQYWTWRLLDREVYLALWIVIFAMTGFYLLGKLKFKGDEEVQHIGVIRLFLSIACFSFVVYMIPGMWGAPLNGISGFLPPMDTQDFNLERSIYESTKNVTVAGATDENTVIYDALPADRKYADRLHMPSGFQGFYDIEEAKAYAKEQGKPIFIDFTGRNCNNCREMEQYVWADPNAKKILNEEYVMCALYCDMNDINLAESDYVTDDKGRVLKTLGRKNLHFQRSKFNQIAQPYYVIIDADGNVLTKNNYSYSRDVNKFVEFLKEGVSNFSKK